ncbi:MAG: Uma2 family endonuclease [Hymenobacter sp.]|nr:MAG: Uma2 family endonuclease [Hymenobacter sp.]
MGQPEVQAKRYTPEEYFALEMQSPVRHEYFEGEVFAMAGASVAHSLIKGNLIAGLRPGMRLRGCRLVDENVRLAVQEAKYYYYPDVMVSCESADRRESYTWKHPVLIAEILSPSTAEYDRTTKFENYQKIPSLRHYLLISRAAWVVEWFRRDEAGQWIYTLLTGPDGTLEIPDMGLVLPLRELYEDTDVAPLRALPLAAGDGSRFESAAD